MLVLLLVHLACIHRFRISIGSVNDYNTCMAFRYAEIGDVPATRGDDLSDPLRHMDVRRRVLTSLCAVNILCTHFCTLLPANQLSVHAYGRGNSAY